MLDFDKYLNEFELECKKHFTATLEGDWRTCNKSMKKIQTIFDFLREHGSLNRLMSLLDNELPEVRSMAALYCLPMNSEKCLKVLEEIYSNEDSILRLSTGQAIKNWKNGEYYLWD